MQSKNVLFFSVILCGAVFFGGARAQAVVEEVTEEIQMEQLSANAVAAYDANGSLFQQITDLEQEKVLMQLEKERAQLDLELDRLAAEKIKLHMEIDTLSGRAEQQQQEIETQKAKLEAEAARIEKEKEEWIKEIEDVKKQEVKDYTSSAVKQEAEVDVSKNWRLVNVVGAGAQLQATVEDLNNGQKRRVSVGKTLDGLTVKTISLYDGVVLVDKDGNTQVLNITNGK